MNQIFDAINGFGKTAFHTPDFFMNTGSGSVQADSNKRVKAFHDALNKRFVPAWDAVGFNHQKDFFRFQKR